MKRNVKKIFALALPLVMCFGLGVSLPDKSEEPIETNAIGNYSTNPNTYYDGITATSGKQLAAQLHDLITSTHRYYSTYADNGGNGYQKQTDQYYENGTKVSGYIYAPYVILTQLTTMYIPFTNMENRYFGHTQLKTLYTKHKKNYRTFQLGSFSSMKFSVVYLNSLIDQCTRPSTRTCPQ